MKQDFDIAVVGSGFGGSLMAMIAKRLGHSVILLEKGKHPRFAIGESSTPLANLLLEELARRYDLPALLPFSKWGSWQRSYPQVACGLKRGFTFYHHQWDRRFEEDFERQNQLMVAASPRDEIADTHWFRADFDQNLAQQAQAIGVEYLDELALQGLLLNRDGVTIHGKTQGRDFSISAKFLIDATGPRGFVHRALALSESPFENLPATEGLYSHFTNVRRWDKINRSSEQPPYAADDAALHHVFDRGWIWVLRFNNGITSAGVAATKKLAQEFGFSEGAGAWDRLLRRLPSVREQFVDAAPVRSFVHAPQLSFRSSEVSGARWVMLPSAAGFIDPLLSTGFALTLLGIHRLATVIEEDWETERLEDRLRLYSRETRDDLSAAELLVAALYGCMGNFSAFSLLSLLYFGAVSFSETARRLGRPELADSFLLHRDPKFGPNLRECCQQILREVRRGRVTAEVQTEFRTKVIDAIAPFDAAGLCDMTRKNWYPVNASDLINAAPKFGVGVEEVKDLLLRNGFILPAEARTI